jgi:hypothetical protein
MDNNISEDKDMNFLSHRVQISLGAEVPLGTKKQKTIEERYKKPCTYWDYILPGELIKLQKGREGKGLNHHDEHLFIIVHQTFELWFKQVRQQQHCCLFRALDLSFYFSFNEGVV